jgi:HSP20 family molecular chaperone IbpA
MNALRSIRDRKFIESPSLFDQLFGTYYIPTNTKFHWIPERCAVDLKENQLDLAFSVQGFNPDDVHINCYSDRITIKAKNEKSKNEEDVVSQFTINVDETVTLTPEFDGKLAEAIIKNGILKITIPKGEAAQPKLLKPKAE